MNKLETFGLIAAQAERGEISFPTSVNAVLRLQRALEDPDCHSEEAIKLVLGEPQLAARTVAMANSVAYGATGGGGGLAVTNVRVALGRIGMRNLQLLVSSLVVRQFGSRIVNRELRAKAEQLWQHTAHVAALARVLALRLTGVDADTAVFAAIVHEVGGFYLLSRADEFPGLLDADPENWIALCEEVVSAEVLKKLAIPAPVFDAIGGMRHGLMGMPPASLLDTLLLANRLAPVASPLDSAARPTPALAHEHSVLDLLLDRATLDDILAEAREQHRVMSAVLLV
ncbi:HDOD domain-containing protein [Massilia sp. PWRC2]|uniref:HDOD domain-containing protein n=1 Tax=Massilia sp. PWRC2 TaxID=2804626 RepID=UPI003CEC8C41